MKPKIIYFADDPYAAFEDLQIAIPDAWVLPELGSYIDDQGSVTALPPFDDAIKIVKLSEFLKKTVAGYI